MFCTRFNVSIEMYGHMQINFNIKAQYIETLPPCLTPTRTYITCSTVENKSMEIRKCVSYPSTKTIYLTQKIEAPQPSSGSSSAHSMPRYIFCCWRLGRCSIFDTPFHFGRLLSVFFLCLFVFVRTRQEDGGVPQLNAAQQGSLRRKNGVHCLRNPCRA